MIATVTVSILVARGPLPPRGWGETNGASDGDLAMYRAIVDRLHSGGSYYDVVGSELRSRDFPRVPFPNWRTPLHLVLLANVLGPVRASLLLRALAVLVLVEASFVARADGPVTATVLLVALFGALLPCFVTSAVYFSEVWAGVWIALSALAFARGRGRLGVVSAILALFFRELAVVYCGAALLVSVLRRRRSEVIAWVIGLGLYAVYLGVHVVRVYAHLQPADWDARRSWIVFGGIPFLIDASRMNAFLAALPSEIAAVLLPLTVLGLVLRRDPRTLCIQLGAASYLVVFYLAGAPMNFYWGSICVPLLAFGLGWSIPALRILLVTSFSGLKGA